MAKPNRDPVLTRSAEAPEVAALAIALATAPPPRVRSALFRERSLAEAQRAFEERYGSPEARLVERARRWREEARKCGRRLVLLGEANYPALLARIAVPPIALDVAGAADLAAPAVAIVGSRRATPYGISVAGELSGSLAAAGFTIVSGLARGVDAAAHRGALRAGGTTIAIFGAGHRHLYPSEHRGLARRIAVSGALVSEFPPEARPLPHHFPRRNRIIAGLCRATVVVEAALRSGSLSTARHALESDREVLAVPGPIGSPTSAGCHELVRQGAALAASVDHILEEIGEEGLPAGKHDPAEEDGSGPAAAAGPESRPSAHPAAERQARPAPSARPALPQEGSDAARLRELLAGFPTGVDADSLIAGCGLPVPAALAAITELERRGLVRRFPGDYLKASG